MTLFAKLGIENEADNRYEGLDYDDVDTRPNESSCSEHLGHEEERDVVDGQLDHDRTVDPTGQNVDALEEAEAQYEASKAAAGARERLKRRLEERDAGWNPQNSRECRAMASFLVRAHARLQRALRENTKLALQDAAIPLAAAITTSCVPDNMHKSTAEVRIANVLRSVSKAETVDDVEKLQSYTIGEHEQPSHHIVNLVKRAEGAAEQATSDPSSEEVAVRTLLMLTATPVDANLLMTEQVGKRVRRLKKSNIPNIAAAASLTVSAWKACVVGST
jgi:hypothetical protein